MVLVNGTVRFPNSGIWIGAQPKACIVFITSYLAPGAGITVPYQPNLVFGRSRRLLLNTAFWLYVLIRRYSFQQPL